MKPKCSSYWACPDSLNEWYRWQQTMFILNTIKYTTPYLFGPDTDFVIVGGDDHLGLNFFGHPPGTERFVFTQV